MLWVRSQKIQPNSYDGERKYTWHAVNKRNDRALCNAFTPISDVFAEAIPADGRRCTHCYVKALAMNASRTNEI